MNSLRNGPLGIKIKAPSDGTEHEQPQNSMATQGSSLGGGVKKKDFPVEW